MEMSVNCQFGYYEHDRLGKHASCAGFVKMQKRLLELSESLEAKDKLNFIVKSADGSVVDVCKNEKIMSREAIDDLIANMKE